MKKKPLGPFRDQRLFALNIIENSERFGLCGWQAREGLFPKTWIEVQCTGIEGKLPSTGGRGWGRGLKFLDLFVTLP